MKYLIRLAAVVAAGLLVSCAGSGASSSADSPRIELPMLSTPGIPYPAQELALPVDPQPVGEPNIRGTSIESVLPLAASDAYMRSEHNTLIGDPPEFLHFEPGPGEAAWAIYRFEGMGEANLPFVLSAEIVDPLPGSIFLGTADYDAGRWQWQEFHPSSNELASGVPLEWFPISLAGNVYFVLLTFDAGPATVAQVNLVYNTTAPPPVGLQASQGGDGSAVHLTWESLPATYPGIEFASIRVERTMNPNGEWDQLSDIPPEETEFADVWHPAENPYPYRETQFYRLRSVIGDEPGPPGNIAEGWRELVPVQALNATDASFDDFIQITWEGVPGADGYELEYRRIGEPLPPFEMLQRIEGGAITWFEHSSTFPPGRCAEQRQYYEYRLHATIGSDCCATWSEPDQGCLNAEPTPSLSASNDQGPRPLTVQFDGSSSYDWDGGELTFEWDWESDGTWDLTETIGVVSHTYVEEGVYQATMQVTDDEGSQDWFSHFGYVSGWQHTWSSTGEMLSGIAVDDQYNIYAIGTTLNSPGSDIDGLILKYSSAGNLLWARRWSGASDDYLIDGCIDGDGNLHAIGCTQSVGEGIDDVLLLKLAPDGTLLWQKTWGSSNQEKGQAICRKGTEIAVCGYIWEAGGTDLKGLILTYDASTGALNWHKEVSCSQSLSFDDIELGFGQYVLTGYYDVGPEYNANTYVGAVNVETAALISETAFDGGSFDSGNDVAVDMDTGYIYVSGMTDSYTTNRYQQIVLKLDSTLTLVWSKHIGDADEYDQPMGIWAGDGHVYTSGTQSHGLLNSIALCDLDEAGNLSSFWLIGTESECSQGLNLTIDSEGRLAMVGIANSAYMQVQPAPCSSLNAAGNLLSPGSTIADCNGTLTGQSVTWLTPSGIEDENNNDQNAGYIARLDLSVL